MSNSKPLADWMVDRGLDVRQLAAMAELDIKVVEAIVAGRYTTSPQQREKLAKTLGVSTSDIRWGGAVEVDHMYGHGPQFGRSP